MTDRSFLTNILVYAYDVREPIKQARAQEVLKQGIENETAILSVQVIGEFFTVVTKRILKPLSVEEAEEVLNFLSICQLSIWISEWFATPSQYTGNTASHTGTP